jgi:hypothetical protein
VGELEDLMAKQQQQRTDENQARLDQVEAGRRLLDEFVALMKRNGKSPIPVFRREVEDLGMTKTKKFMRGHEAVFSKLTTFFYVGNGWLVQEGIGDSYRTGDATYYVPEQGTVRGNETNPPCAGINTGSEKRDNTTYRDHHETRVPPEMPTTGKIVVTEHVPTGGFLLFADQANQLASRARQLLES